MCGKKSRQTIAVVQRELRYEVGGKLQGLLLTTEIVNEIVLETHANAFCQV